MNWYKKSQLNIPTMYHTTPNTRLPKNQEEGLKIGSEWGKTTGGKTLIIKGYKGIQPIFLSKHPKEFFEEGDAILKINTRNLPQQEFETIKKEVPGRTEKEALYDYYDAHFQSVHDVLNEFKQSKPGDKQPWSVVPFARLKKIWEDYMKMGFVRDEKGMEQIARQMIENTHRLAANTYLMEHTPLDPREHFEDYNITKKEEQRFIEEYLIDEESGQWRISDYGLDKLEELALQLEKTYKAEEQLQIVDRMLNIVHQRSDFPSMFIEGGTKNLNELFRSPNT